MTRCTCNSSQRKPVSKGDTVWWKLSWANTA